jgi:CHAT domain-containing protein
MPYLIAIEMQKSSHAIDSAHEIIALSGDYQKAFHQFIETLSAEKETIGHVIGYIPEKQQLEFLSTKKKNLDALLSLVIKHLPGDPEAINAAFDTWISRKGLVLEAQRQFQDAVAYADDPESIMIFQELSQVREELSSLVLSVQDQADKEEKKLQIDELKKEKERLEFKLRLSNPAYALKTQIDDADGRKIASLLPKGTVLLDFARVNMFNFDPSDEKEESWQPPHYIVFALHAGSGERLTMIDLGEAEKIDDSISDFKLHLKTKIHLSKEGDGLNEKAQNLYNLVFAPIIKTLGNTKEIYISPDGNLNLIPFEVMQNSKGRYLIEDYTFNYLAASREMLGFGQIKGESGKSVIIGDPDFDLEDEIQPHKAPTDSDGSSNYVAQRSIRMSGLHFERLINTRKEAVGIYGFLGEENAALYMDKEATESALFNHKAPRILHLATHGFFLNDQDHGSSDDRGSIIQMKTPSKSTHTTDSIENPLHCSGIALAGANTTLKNLTQQRSAGIVTAEKILRLKLRGTEMVVLSACETGVGQVQSGEGVFGLRRTFFPAGTQSLVMSLWSVPDKETQELMVQFYKNIAVGMKRNQALRQAALKQMQIVTERYGYSYPYYWGAFVFQGES